MALSFAEMEARDRAAALEPDGREDDLRHRPDRPCPVCGKEVVDVYEERNMIGGRENVTTRFYHTRETYCPLTRRF